VYVKYVVEKKTGTGESLSFANRPALLLEEEAAGAEFNAAEFVELIPAAHLISFEYLKSLSSEGDFEWQEVWEPTIDRGIPLAIRLTLQENENNPPIKLIARIIPTIDTKS
jgi:hypothetical protein